MKVEIKITADNGNVLVLATPNPFTPFEWEARWGDGLVSEDKKQILMGFRYLPRWIDAETAAV